MSKADYAYQTLRAEILSRQIAGGSVMRQDDLARRLGVSITPVREALRRLETDQLISYEAHHGATVIELSSEAIDELYKVRGAVEGLAARMAAERASVEQIAELWRIHSTMEADFRNHALDRLGGASEELHLAIADIGGPEFIGPHIRSIRSNYPVPSSASLWRDLKIAAELLVIHEKLLKHLEQGEPAAAEQVMVKHIEYGAQLRLSPRAD